MTRAEAVTHFRGEQKHYSAFMQPSLAEACKIAADAIEAVERLEAEIQVRDNMGNEVLRILREATGRRDFHSEMEAAAWAAKLLAEARRDGARLDWLQEWMKFGRNDLLTRYRVFDGKVYANRIHPDDAMGAKAISGQDNIRAAIDAAIKEAK